MVYVVYVCKWQISIFMFSRVWCIDRLSALGGCWDLGISPIALWVGMMVSLGLDSVIGVNEFVNVQVRFTWVMTGTMVDVWLATIQDNTSNSVVSCDGLCQKTACIILPATVC